MSPRSTRTIRAALVKKGFVQQEDSSHQVFILFVGVEKKKIRTHYSHGAKECDDYILGQMAKQLSLSRTQLDALIDCQMSGEEYVKILRDIDVIKT
jgi:hypothetical protein